MASNDTIGRIHSLLSMANIPYSGMSWNGFNLVGDRESIEEVKRLQWVESYVIHQRATIAMLETKLKEKGDLNG